MEPPGSKGTFRTVQGMEKGVFCFHVIGLDRHRRTETSARPAWALFHGRGTFLALKRPCGKAVHRFTFNLFNLRGVLHHGFLSKRFLWSWSRVA